MIYTVTLNPSLDYVLDVPNFQPGKTNRTAGQQLVPGGKGINVSLALKELGVAGKALGFPAGFTGRQIMQALDQIGLCCDFIFLEDGVSRINIKLATPEGTEINGIGPEIPAFALALLVRQLGSLESNDYLVLSGSVPPTLPDDIYARLIQAGTANGAQAVVDTCGKYLTATLPMHPFLIKPNRHELEELFGVTVETKAQAIFYAQKLQQMGAQNVMVSLGGDGAVLVTHDGQSLTAPAPKGEIVNTVGCGDAMIAGFLAGWQEHHDYLQAFSMAVATGSACAFTQGFASKASVLALLNKTV